MPSKTERAERAAGFHLLEERAAAVLTAFPDLNKHYALQLATDYRLWDGDERWREVAANTTVGPCLLSCCNPTN